MTGHNHYLDCTCGWCVKYGRRATRRPVVTSGGWERTFRTFESFTIPNAACPVCGASVFFYQSPSGGRVFFDELGPPWPKHPCTDNGRPPSRPIRLESAPKASPHRWQRDGWVPITINASRFAGTWQLIPVQNLKTHVFFEALAESRLHLAGETAAMMKPWDGNGWSVISYIELDGSAEDVTIPIFEKRRYRDISRFAALNQRAKAARGGPRGY